jgi:hypothetical protein
MPDDLRKSAYELSRRWVAELDKANPIIVVIDNVADYYWGGAEETWNITDFPSLAPPWPLTFLEYRAPTKIVGPDGTTPFDKEALGQHFGILLDSVEPGTDVAFRGLPKGLPAGLSELLPGHREELVPPPGEGCKWIQQASVFSELRGDILLLGTFSWTINDDGVLSEGWEDIGGLPFLAPFNPKLSEDERHQWGHNCWCFLVPALLAVSFIHCRNTQLIDNHPSPALCKATKRRHGIRPITFKTLEIEPVKKMLAQKANAASGGLRLALHICRGHFKDYRQSRGLFGKHKELYWWDCHVRGHLKEGVVIKDYAIGKEKAGTDPGL